VIHDLDDYKNAISRILTSEPTLVYITQRMRLSLFVRVYGKQKLILPPDSPYASFTTDLLGIAFPKGSVLTVKFNSM